MSGNKLRKRWTKYLGLSAQASVVHWQVREGEREKEKEYKSLQSMQSKM